MIHYWHLYNKYRHEENRTVELHPYVTIDVLRRVCYKSGNARFGLEDTTGLRSRNPDNLKLKVVSSAMEL